MYLSRLVFIYSSQKRELFVVNTSVFVQSTISLKIETKFSRGEEKTKYTNGNSVGSLGRVLVVPFQNVSLKGILVMLCPIFSAFSVNRKKCMMDPNHQNCMLILKISKEGYL